MRQIIEARPSPRPSPQRGEGERAAAAARSGPRAGFTLVEMLMVVLIISMLIALLLPAVQAAKVAAVKAAMKLEVDQLNNSMRAFKDKYGSYPPDRNWTTDEIVMFLHRAFPRYAPQSDPTLKNTATTLKNLNEAESLVFWLGGRWDGAHLTGLSADANPKPDIFMLGGQRTSPLFSFVETQLADADGNGFPEYYPATVKIQYFPPNTYNVTGPPYVCFSARPNGKYWVGDNQNGGDTSTLPQYTPYNMPTTAVPYMGKQADTPNDKTHSYWVNPTGIQIICAGIDNDYGAVAQKLFPFGTNYSTADVDNLTNFTDRDLGAAKP